ncbi:hypothetical protein R1flu_025502 [Riccia fluitans]|uniref:Uncharacterized protein n=1 Tax=Riccia fluitans TaxID=41844 RepID=A0ABD1XYA9_9MARC
MERKATRGEGERAREGFGLVVAGLWWCCMGAWDRQHVTTENSFVIFHATRTGWKRKNEHLIFRRPRDSRDGKGRGRRKRGIGGYQAAEKDTEILVFVVSKIVELYMKKVGAMSVRVKCKLLGRGQIEPRSGGPGGGGEVRGSSEKISKFVFRCPGSYIAVGYLHQYRKEEVILAVHQVRLSASAGSHLKHYYLQQVVFCDQYFA